MKNGILYFLKIDRVTFASRAILALIIFIMFRNPPRGIELVCTIAVGVVAILCSMCHVHSNKYVRNLINTSQETFVNDFRHHFDLSENCDIHITRSFAADKNTRLSRRLDDQIIYPHLVFMTYYETMRHLVIHIRVKSLLKEDVEEDFFYEVPKGSSLDLRLEKVDAKIEQVLIKFPDIDGKSIPEFPIRIDFHLRNMLKACSCEYKL